MIRRVPKAGQRSDYALRWKTAAVKNPGSGGAAGRDNEHLIECDDRDMAQQIINGRVWKRQ